MAFIIRVSQDYKGQGWVWYDSAFQQQAALLGNQKWLVINSTLFSMNFAVRPSSVRRCERCFTTTHSKQECAQYGDQDPDVGDRLRSLETAVLAMARPRPPSQEPVHHGKSSGEACRKWNASGCSFPRCRHLHVCSKCGGGHPASRCGTRGIGGSPAVSHQGTRPY